MPAKAKAKANRGCQRKDRKHQTSNARTETSQPGCPAQRRQKSKNPKTQKPHQQYPHNNTKNHIYGIMSAFSPTPMETLIVLLVLLSAMLHASWNAFLRMAQDRSSLLGMLSIPYLAVRAIGGVVLPLH